MARTYVVLFLSVLMFSGTGGKRTEECKPVVIDKKEVLRTETYYEDTTRSFGKPGSPLSHPVMKKSCENARQTTPPADTIANVPRDCADIQARGETISGIYGIHPRGVKNPFNVFCDMETAGGGWTVFQRRLAPAGTANFSVNMTAYKHGFGSVDAEHWLGNDKLHHLTNQKAYELRLDIENLFHRKVTYAHYRHFVIGNETRNYTLTVNGHFGVAGDALSRISGRPFSTHPQQIDCNGGWWHDPSKKCNPYFHLNGIRHKHFQRPVGRSAFGLFYGVFVKASEMKIRPV
ncbi:ryncolin-4-like [Strongylocentrotus purpuratus]|uniref:Fibrinogen C-terminal domain-containing protein n=1 Tax=Strongylocentrotus purpuratus TaxID=7668 RepID=A0A7M7NEM5_STRPU|nr:ryncolin-4-like [Strongylocentrotus purpuratus]